MNDTSKRILYKVILIEPWANGEGHAFTLHSDEIHDTYYTNSNTAFGQWLSRERIKIGDKIVIKIKSGQEIDYAEILEK